MTSNTRRRASAPWKSSTTAAAVAILWFVAASAAQAASFIPLNTQSAGEYEGIEYAQHFGLFAGTTAKGPFVMPYQIFAPADPAEGNGAVVVEPPHFAFGAGLGRDTFLGRDLLFTRGFAHASVGFSEFLLNILAPVPGLQIAGEAAQLCNPGIPPGCVPVRDIEIIEQFSEALASDPWAFSILGPVARRYAFGSSQTAEVLNEMIYGLGIEGLFDMTLLSLTVWQIEIDRTAGGPAPGAIPDDFVPRDGIGKVIFVNAEGDQFFSEAEELRAAAGHPDYRLYEVAGAPHFASGYLPPPLSGLPGLNPLDVKPVNRAAFIAGHRWVTRNRMPPANAILASVPAGRNDPVYGFPTGIARDGDGNALGGVQLPDIAIGRGRYQAWTPAPALPLPDGTPAPLLGLFTDLVCEPPAGSTGNKPRFRNHGSYVSGYARQAGQLVRQGYLLPEDAERMIEDAAESDIGKPRSCR